MNKSSFTIRVYEQIHSFTLSVYDFALTTTWIVRFKLGIKFVANMILSALISTTVNLKTIRVIPSVLKLIYSNSPTINIKGITITAPSKMIGKMTASIKNTVKIVATSKAITKPFTTLKSGFIHIVADTSLGHFLALSIHDPKLLSVVDVVTLEDLDFEIL